MYLLSPGGETLFLIPGVEVVHKAPTTLTLPEETKGKITTQVRLCFLYPAFPQHCPAEPSTGVLCSKAGHQQSQGQQPWWGYTLPACTVLDLLGGGVCWG